MSNIERKYAYYDEGVLPEEGEYGVTYLTLYSSNAGNVYDGWIWDPEHKTTESLTERTFGFRNPDYPDYCYDDEVVVDLSNAQNREESSEFAQGRITSFNTNVSSRPIILEDIDITGLTEEERENKATTVLFSAIPLVDDSYIQAMVEVQCKVNLSPDNTTGIVRVEAFYILNDESDRTMRPNPVHTFSVSSANERHTLPWLYWNPALKHEDNNYIGVKLIATGGTVEIGISDDPDYGDAMITLTSAGLTGDNIFSGKPIALEIFGLDEVIAGYKLDIDDYTVLCTYDTGEIYEVTHMCDYNPAMGTEIIDPITILTAYYQGLSASMPIRLGTIAYIELDGVDSFHDSMELSMDDYTVLAYFDNGDVWDVTKECAYDPNMGTTITEDTTLTAYYRPWWMCDYSHDTIGRYGQGNIDLYNRPMYIQPEDGTVSTVNSMSIYEDGKEVLIPTIGRDENGNPIQMENDEAIDYYYETGEYLGKFDTVQEADAYAEQLHLQQEELYDLEDMFSDSMEINCTGAVYKRYGTPGQGLVYTQYEDGYMEITGSVIPYRDVTVEYDHTSLSGAHYPPIAFKPNRSSAFTKYQFTTATKISLYESSLVDPSIYSSHSYPDISSDRYNPNLFVNIPHYGWKKITTLEWKATGKPLGLRFTEGRTIDKFKGFDKMDTSNIYILDEAFKGFNYSGFIDDPINDLLSSMEFPKLVSLVETFYGVTFHDGMKVTLHANNIINMSRTFMATNIIPDIDFRTSNVKYFTGTFLSSRISKADALSDLDTHNVIDMTECFCDCDNLSDISGIRSWSTQSVTCMCATFANTGLESTEDLRLWNGGNIFSAEYIFAGCIALIDADDVNSVLNSIRNPVSVDKAFYDANIFPFTGDHGNLHGAFLNCLNMVDASGIGTIYPIGEVIAADMFRMCSKLEKIDFVISNIYNASSMFRLCSVLEDIDMVKFWYMGLCTTIADMFNNTSIYDYPKAVSGWNTGSMISISYAFYHCYPYPKDEQFVQQTGYYLKSLDNWDVTRLESDAAAFTRGPQSISPPLVYNVDPSDPSAGTAIAIPWWQNSQHRT